LVAEARTARKAASAASHQAISPKHLHDISVRILKDEILPVKILPVKILHMCRK